MTFLAIYVAGMVCLENCPPTDGTMSAMYGVYPVFVGQTLVGGVVSGTLAYMDYPANAICA